MKPRARIAKTAALNRRTLFRYAGAGGVMALLPAGVGRSAPAPAAQAAKTDPFELEEATILDLQKRMVSGEDSARSLAEKYTRPHRRAGQARAGAALRDRDQPGRARRSPRSSTRNARPDGCAGRCTASRS